MADTFTAVVSIAHLSFKAIELARRVLHADADAERLCDRTQRAASLANIVEQVIANRHRAAGDAARLPIERSILSTIEQSLDEYRRSLTAISVKLRAFEESNATNEPAHLIDRCRFVRSTELRAAQEIVLDRQIANLTLSAVLLNSFDLQVLRYGSLQGLLALDHDPPRIVPVNTENDGPQTPELVQNGNSLTTKDHDNWTPLHHAADRLDYDALERLLEQLDQLPPGQQLRILDAATREDQTALMLTASHADDARSKYVAHALLKRDCNVNVRDEQGRSALSHAVEERDEERVRFAWVLVHYGADVNHVRQKFPGKFERIESSELYIKLSPQVQQPLRERSVRFSVPRRIQTDRNSSLPKLAKATTDPTGNAQHKRRSSWVDIFLTSRGGLDRRNSS